MTSNLIAKKRIAAFVKVARRGRPAHLDVVVASREKHARQLLLSDLEELVADALVPRKTKKPAIGEVALERTVRAYVKRTVQSIATHDAFWEELALSLELPGFGSLPSACYDQVNKLLAEALKRVSRRLD